MTGWIILGIVAVVVIIMLVSYYNGFVALKNRMDEAFSTIDVYLKKRYDLIPNMVETVKGYAKHESETFTQVVNARNHALESNTIAEKIDSEKELTTALSRLLMLSENYPELKANEQFSTLSAQLSAMETELAQARKYFNGVVKEYNTKAQSFPSVIVAKLFGFHEEKFFTVESDAERKNIDVKF